jgi:hypothetical protein
MNCSDEEKLECIRHLDIAVEFIIKNLKKDHEE